MARKVTTEGFISEAKAIHGDVYDYSEVNYIRMASKVTLICKKHGPFLQTPHNHLLGMGCKICGQEKRSNNAFLDTDAFVEKAVAVHGDKYDYSHVVYERSCKKVEIICKKHGSFMQEASKHLQGNGCKLCANEAAHHFHTMGIDAFIKKAQSMHGDRYKYDKVDYKNNYTKVILTCHIHGDFTQLPGRHLQGCGCPECGKESSIDKNTKTTNEFIDQAIKIHGDKYDYSHTVYTYSLADVQIMCKKHGIFTQKAHVHLQGSGCQQCAIEEAARSNTLDTTKFIKMSKEVHGDTYDYSQANYIHSHSKVAIICSVHGVFHQKASDHIYGRGCPLCARINDGLSKRSNTEEFVAKANKVHSNKYNYTKTVYELRKQAVCITCPVHGDFMQIPQKHLSGTGCPSCSASKGEETVAKWLQDRNIEFSREYRFKDCINKKTLPFDFYLPNYNIVIEYQGEHHYMPISYWGGEVGFKYRQQNDSIKRQYCLDNGIRLIEIPYTDFDNIEKILEDALIIH